MQHKRNLADMCAILADLEQSRDCCEILISGTYKDSMRVRRALYESAFISFRRALINGSTRRPEFGNAMWGFNKQDHIEVTKGLDNFKKEILEVANKCVAHRALKVARIVEFPRDENTGNELVKTRYIERNDLLVHIKEITNRYIKLLLEKLIPSEVLLLNK